MMTEIEEKEDKEAQKNFELLIGKVSLTEENSKDFKTFEYKEEIIRKDQIVVCENDSGPKPQIRTVLTPLHYNQLPNSKCEPMTAPQIISTGNRPHSVQSPNHTQSQQPLMSHNLYNYNQQQNRDFTSQHQMQVMANRSKQFPGPFQSNSADQHFPKTCAVQQPQMINSSSNQQHFSPPQHQTTAYNSILTAVSKQQYTTPSPQQHVTTFLAQCAIQALPPAIQQLSLVLPRNPTVVRPKTLYLPMTNAPNSDGVLTPTMPSNKPVVNNAQSKSPNSTVLLPTTYSEVLDLSMSEDKVARQNLLAILCKEKGWCEKKRDQSRLRFARRCVAGMTDKDLELINPNGENYLHFAVYNTDVYIVEALLERIKLLRKRDMINKQNKSLQTPLYMAVSLNKPDMVRRLVTYGANINLKGTTRRYTTEGVECSPIHYAASEGKKYCDTLQELFKSKNMELDILDSDGFSALHCAIRKHGKLVSNQKSSVTKIDNCQNVSALLRNKANPNLQDRCSGKTPLMYAIESKDYAMIDTILKAVDSSMIPELLQTETFDGQTCMSIADGLRNEFDPHTWEKLHNFLLA